MNNNQVYCLLREPEYSPGKVDDDAAILRATATVLGAKGFQVTLAGAREASSLGNAKPALILTMCQGAEALTHIEKVSESVPVVNAPRAITNCYRERMVELLAAANIKLAPSVVVDTVENGSPAMEAPLWVKRAGVHAMEIGDVAYAANSSQARIALAALRSRGIERAALQRHIDGPVVKFYGVAGGSFFHCRSDLSQPRCNLSALKQLAEKAASALELTVYGGDAVVESSGKATLIDINDWPSFSACRQEAARAIASYVTERWLREPERGSREQGGELL